MTTVICPKCGTENPSDAVNCRKCRIILKLALEHAEKLTSNECGQIEDTSVSIIPSEPQTPFWIKYIALTVVIALVLIILFIFSPKTEPGDEVVFIFGCALSLTTYISFFLGFIFYDLKRFIK